MAKKIIAISAAVDIAAAMNDDEKKEPRTFSSTFYTGGALSVAGYEMPVVIDLQGLTNGKVLVANLDHDSSKRVGNFDVVNDGKSLIANGKATAATAARDEVVNSAAAGYQWQASLEVNPTKIETLAKGKRANVNGQSFEGPLYITRAGVLKGFAFVSHGADDNTNATIAASAASSNQEKKMDEKLKAWIEAMGFDPDTLSDTQLAGLKANYEGKNKKAGAIKANDPFEAKRLEAKRKEGIREVAARMIEVRGSDSNEITEIENMCEHAIEAGDTVQDFRLKLQEACMPQAFTVTRSRRDEGISQAVLEAAVCIAGRLPDADLVKKFGEQTLEAASREFKSGIGLRQLFHIAARAHGHDSRHSSDMNSDVLRAAFSHQPIRGTGFSTIDISSIVSNTANKFLMRGWNSIDNSCMEIATVRSVRDFKQITTVSLTDNVIFEEVAADGQIKHKTLGEITYNNQAKTYAGMLAITRQDFINDDLGALTDVPMKLGIGGAKKRNDIFWTEFLDNSAFFTSGRSNVNEAVADMTIGGLTATEVIFMNQTNPDGTPLGIMPSILLVPTALKAAAIALTDTQSQLITGASATLSNVNVFRGRFRVVSSPYMSNSAYTGNSSAAWYMLANPSELPVIEIAALNGRIEPVVDTAEADFATLGVQMRGYCDIGVALQEYRAGVRADGGSS